MNEVAREQDYVMPAQCSCGHIYLERYVFPKRDGEHVGFVWCGFCRTRREVYATAPASKSQAKRKEVAA